MGKETFILVFWIFKENPRMLRGPPAAMDAENHGWGDSVTSMGQRFRQENGKQRFGNLGALIRGRLGGRPQIPWALSASSWANGSRVEQRWEIWPADTNSLRRWVSLPEPSIPLGLLPATVVGNSAWLHSLICRWGPWCPWGGDPVP